MHKNKNKKVKLTKKNYVQKAGASNIPASSSSLLTYNNLTKKNVNLSINNRKLIVGYSYGGTFSAINSYLWKFYQDKISSDQLFDNIFKWLSLINLKGIMVDKPIVVYRNLQYAGDSRETGYFIDLLKEKMKIGDITEFASLMSVTFNEKFYETIFTIENTIKIYIPPYTKFILGNITESELIFLPGKLQKIAKNDTESDFLGVFNYIPIMNEKLNAQYQKYLSTQSSLFPTNID